MLDPISDMLTRIRNASSAGHTEVLLPMSKLKLKLAEVMQKKHFVANFSETEVDGRRHLRIILRYSDNEKGKKISYIQGLKRVSKQGQRIYAKKDHIPIVKSGFGFAVISTSAGLMTDAEARKAGLGGEVICEIW